MADKMYIQIHISKEVPDQATGRAIYDMVKERLADRPDVRVSGGVSNTFVNEE